MKKKTFGVYVIFGTGASKQFDEEGKVDLTPDDGSVDLHEFETEEERTAFIDGVNCASGWLESSFLLTEYAKVTKTRISLKTK